MPDERIFEYGGFWLGKVRGSDCFYACWYDPRGRRTRRRSLGTQELDEAKKQLVEKAGAATLQTDRSPERVMIATVLDHYCDHRGDDFASSFQARRAVEVVTDFLAAKGEATAKVASFGPIKQRDFMQWTRATLGHSPATIARNLSVVSAAFRYAASLQRVVDGFGTEAEVVLLDHHPTVVTDRNKVAEALALPDPTPRDWLPTYTQFGQFIDALGDRQEPVFRFIILALNTWARPEAITDLRVSTQIDFERGLVDLNPPGRRQNAKRRPVIRLTDNLAGWLRFWDSDAPMQWAGEPVASVKKAWQRQVKALGLPLFTRYAIRHFMATECRRVKPPVSREQRAHWLGHVVDRGNRTTDIYEKFDPEYLADCAQATEAIIAKLQKHTKRRLAARKPRAKPVLSLVSGTKAA
jgi:integrase